MIKQHEEPDLVLEDSKNRDKVIFTVRNKTIFISCQIDDCGNQWEIPLKQFKEKLGLK